MILHRQVGAKNNDAFVHNEDAKKQSRNNLYFGKFLNVKINKGGTKLQQNEKYSKFHFDKVVPHPYLQLSYLCLEVRCSPCDPTTTLSNLYHLEEQNCPKMKNIVKILHHRSDFYKKRNYGEIKVQLVASCHCCSQVQLGLHLSFSYQLHSLTHLLNTPVSNK